LGNVGIFPDTFGIFIDAVAVKVSIGCEEYPTVNSTKTVINTIIQIYLKSLNLIF
jgi:hypothetical protein